MAHLPVRAVHRCACGVCLGLVVGTCLSLSEDAFDHPHIHTEVPAHVAFPDQSRFEIPSTATATILDDGDWWPYTYLSTTAPRTKALPQFTLMLGAQDDFVPPVPAPTTEPTVLVDPLPAIQVHSTRAV